VIVVADAGPLMAFAKVNGLARLFDLYPLLLITPTVFDETIRAGLALGAEDAVRLQKAYEIGRIEGRDVTLTELPRSARLGIGEAESIRLAIELRADRLLVDDLEAGAAAQHNFDAAEVATVVQGTLGVIAAS
jgi:predicted nucleic acid-binding protein